MNVIREIEKINIREAELGISAAASWHAKYKDSAYIFVGGLDYNLTEGDIICVFSQCGEVVDCNLVRDKESGDSRGFAFVAFEDQQSTVLAVDNFNGAKVLGRKLRVDHVKKYRKPRAAKPAGADSDSDAVEGQSDPEYTARRLHVWDASKYDSTSEEEEEGDSAVPASVTSVEATNEQKRVSQFESIRARRAQRKQAERLQEEGERRSKKPLPFGLDARQQFKSQPSAPEEKVPNPSEKKRLKLEQKAEKKEKKALKKAEKKLRKKLQKKEAKRLKRKLEKEGRQSRSPKRSRVEDSSDSRRRERSSSGGLNRRQRNGSGQRNASSSGDMSRRNKSPIGVPTRNRRSDSRRRDTSPKSGSRRSKESSGVSERKKQDEYVHGSDKSPSGDRSRSKRDFGRRDEFSNGDRINSKRDFGRRDKTSNGDRSNSKRDFGRREQSPSGDSRRDDFGRRDKSSSGDRSRSRRDFDRRDRSPNDYKSKPKREGFGTKGGSERVRVKEGSGNRHGYRTAKSPPRRSVSPQRKSDRNPMSRRYSPDESKSRQRKENADDFESKKEQSPVLNRPKSRRSSRSRSFSV
eukprot:329097_1